LRDGSQGRIQVPVVSVSVNLVHPRPDDIIRLSLQEIVRRSVGWKDELVRVHDVYPVGFRPLHGLVDVIDLLDVIKSAFDVALLNYDIRCLHQDL
jgi:hypothetical protein